MIFPFNRVVPILGDSGCAHLAFMYITGATSLLYNPFFIYNSLPPHSVLC